MNTDRARIFEFVGLATVVLSLLFVGYELRQNQLGLEAQTRANLAQLDIESTRSLREDEALMKLLSDQNPAFDSVDDFRLQLWFREMARTAEHQFYQYRIGAFDDAEFEGMLNLWKANFASSGSIEWWSQYKNQFSTAFIAEFDELVIDN